MLPEGRFCTTKTHPRHQRAIFAVMHSGVLARGAGQPRFTSARLAKLPAHEGRPDSVPSGLEGLPRRRLRSWTLQKPQIERREHQDNSDIHYQPLPEPVPEEQDVHADHNGYQREHAKHDGCLSSHPSSLLTCCGVEQERRLEALMLGAAPPRQRDELAPSHSITSSARPSSGSGTVTPSALAALRFMTSSTLVDCWTGSSAGFSPLRMRPA
jgi:hypothetical protein